MIWKTLIYNLFVARNETWSFGNTEIRTLYKTRLMTTLALMMIRLLTDIGDTAWWHIGLPRWSLVKGNKKSLEMWTHLKIHFMWILLELVQGLVNGGKSKSISQKCTWFYAKKLQQVIARAINNGIASIFHPSGRRH